MMCVWGTGGAQRDVCVRYRSPYHTGVEEGRDIEDLIQV